MPIPEVDKLEKTSSEEQTKAALSSCIAQEIRSGRDPAQAKAMCYSMIREKTGKGLAPKE
jgi:hypothetical protein